MAIVVSRHSKMWQEGAGIGILK